MAYKVSRWTVDCNKLPLVVRLVNGDVKRLFNLLLYNQLNF